MTDAIEEKLHNALTIIKDSKDTEVSSVSVLKSLNYEGYDVEVDKLVIQLSSDFIRKISESALAGHIFYIHTLSKVK